MAELGSPSHLGYCNGLLMFNKMISDLDWSESGDIGEKPGETDDRRTVNDMDHRSKQIR